MVTALGGWRSLAQPIKYRLKTCRLRSGLLKQYPKPRLRPAQAPLAALGRRSVCDRLSWRGGMASQVRGVGGFVASADASAGRTALGLGNAATRTALGTTGALYGGDSILGAVSQSGGVPTGAIIERGSNANGEYTRWADGTRTCTPLRWTLPASDAPWTFPAAFVTTPTTGLVLEGNLGSAVVSGMQWWGVRLPPSN